MSFASLKQNAVFRYFASLKLAVFCLLSLAAILAYGTVAESYFGMRGAKLLVYGTPWFAGVLVLLGVNVFAAAAIRFPWKRHQTGFALTHLGIIIILVGSYMTQKWGVDGNLPVTQGQASGEVILSEPKLVLVDDETEFRAEFPLPETPRPSQGRLAEIKVGPQTKLVMDKYYPRLAMAKKIEASKDGNLGAPAIRLELSNSRFQLEEWLLNTSATGPSELNLGPALVHFSRGWTAADDERFLKNAKAVDNAPKGPGFLMMKYRGKEFRAEISSFLKKWQPVGASGLEMKIEKYFSYAVVEKGELVNRSEETINPAVQLLVRKKGANFDEKHTIFANFPEFSTMHKEHSKGREHIGAAFTMVAGRQSLAMVGNQRGELNFHQSADGKALFYRVLGANGKLNAEGKVNVGEAVSTGWMDLQFKVVEWFPSAVASDVPQPIDYISGGSSEYLSGSHWIVEDERAPASDEAGLWVIEGGGQTLAAGGKKFTISLDKEKLSLPFQIFLKKFTVGHDPGTTKAATYESNVEVRNPLDGNTAETLISMNEPLKYGGYTFYQASYHLPPDAPPVSIFSVNYDPGRPVKYGGSLIMIFGILLMFYMNPHYWDIVLGKGKGKK